MKIGEYKIIIVHAERTHLLGYQSAKGGFSAVFDAAEEEVCIHAQRWSNKSVHSLLYA